MQIAVHAFRNWFCCGADSGHARRNQVKFLSANADESLVNEDRSMSVGTSMGERKRTAHPLRPKKASS